MPNIEYSVIVEDEEDLFIKAMLNKSKVGYINGDRTRERLQLCDICVKPELRRDGIGGTMFKLLLEECRSAGIREVWGWVAKDAVDVTPDLLEWYAKRGFRICEPDAECHRSAFKKIVLRL